MNYCLNFIVVVEADFPDSAPLLALTQLQELGLKASRGLLGAPHVIELPSTTNEWREKTLGM